MVVKIRKNLYVVGRFFGKKSFQKNEKKTCFLRLVDVKCIGMTMGSRVFAPFFGSQRDCTICDDAGGCGCKQPVFPLSMSDFKPGDKE